MTLERRLLLLDSQQLFDEDFHISTSTLAAVGRSDTLPLLEENWQLLDLIPLAQVLRTQRGGSHNG